MTKDINYYCKKFSPRSKSNKIGLNPSKTHGLALHKPILILSVMLMISQRQIIKNQIPLSSELIATFLELWKSLEELRDPKIGLPFFHLTTDGFWHYKPKIGFEVLLPTRAVIRTPKLIRQSIEYAYFDDELFDLLQGTESMSILMYTLINSWFSHKIHQIEKLLHKNAFAELQENLILEGGKVYKPEELKTEENFIVRDALFRQTILNIYGHSCAFCGLKVVDPFEKFIVDGAHIKPFSIFYDDQINNGMALCKNHHWAFDNFWFTISNNYTIIINNQIYEVSPCAEPMSKFHGKQLTLPEKKEYYPRKDAVEWHQQIFFEKAG